MIAYTSTNPVIPLTKLSAAALETMFPASRCSSKLVPKVVACVALYRHKRSHRDDDTEWLEEAVRTAKKQRGC